MKGGREHFYGNFPLISNKLSCVLCLLVGCESLGPLFTTSKADHMYCCDSSQKITEQAQTQLSSKQSICSASFIAFPKSTWTFEHFEKRDDLHSLSMSEDLDSKKCGYLNVLKLLLQNTLGNQSVKGSKTLLKSARELFYANVPLISNKLSCVSCLLVGSEILKPLFTTLMADDMYCCCNWQKIQQQVQSQVSPKPSTSSPSFIPFSKFT